MLSSPLSLFALACLALMVGNPLRVLGGLIGEREIEQPAEASLVLHTRATGNIAPEITNFSFIKATLARANFYRAKHAAVPLIWSPTQAKFAQDQANKCELKHSGGPYGENIYWISSSSIDFNKQTNASFDGWMSEEPLYTQNFMTALHYTQHIWKDSKRIGCAWTSRVCANQMGGFYYFCEYDPAGNVLGQFTKNVSP